MLHFQDYCREFGGGLCRRIGRTVGREYCFEQCAGKGLDAAAIEAARAETNAETSDRPCGVCGERPRRAIFWRKDKRPLGLEGFYEGQGIFLVCNGPSLGEMDLKPLRERLTFGINNGPATLRPTFWTAGDTCGKFLDAIWTDPKIIKFVPFAKARNRYWDSQAGDISRQPVGQCPSIVWHRRNSDAAPETWFDRDRISWAVPRPGGRPSYRLNTMAAAMHILWFLGFERVYIVGADFHMEPATPYCFEEEADAAKAADNNDLYRLTNAFFSILRPDMEARGFRVYNCTPNSGLTAFKTMDYADALKATQPRAPGPTRGRYAGGMRTPAAAAWRKGILYYSHNNLDGTPLNEACRESLKNSKLPITAVTHRPVDFADRNLVVDRPPSLLATLQNIVDGLEAMDEEYVFLAEHDCLYHASHFEAMETQVVYNTNAWRLTPNGYFRHPDAYPVLSACSGPRRVLLAHMQGKLQEYRRRLKRLDNHRRAYPPMIFEPRRRNARRYSGRLPILDVRHRRNSASGIVKRQWDYATTLRHWGDADELNRQLGVMPHPDWMRRRDRQMLGRYRKLVVCGPQRSGTRIHAQIIAETFGLEYIDERRFASHNWQKMRSLIDGKDRYVVQCPALTHKVFSLPPDVGIVYIRRNLEEILESQKRIGWGVDGHHRARDEDRERAKFKPNPHRPIAAIKYEYLMRNRDGRTIELAYGTFDKHPRWVAKPGRKNFKYNQTE